MKLSAIEREHILAAATEMDERGDSSWAEYWVQLDNGREYQFKRLARRAYELATNQIVGSDFFQSNDSYRNFIEKKFGYKVLFKVPENVPFFTVADFEFFSLHGGTPYRKDDESLAHIARRLKETIYKKSNIWVKLLNLEEYTIEPDNRWQMSGTFKPYTWTKIYKPSDSDAKVYFTLGVDAHDECLVYKIDCQRRQYNDVNVLEPEQIKAFDRLIDNTGAKWNEIAVDNINSYDWESLRKRTIDFIGRYQSLYEEAVSVVRNVKKTKVVAMPLVQEPIPISAYESLPQKAYTFRGVTVDYDAENKRAKQTGDNGEQLVIKHEKAFLIQAGRADLAEKVQKAKDGEGYDIFSYYKDGKQKYIEVKTTSGPNTRPFMITDNEWEFMKQNAANYCLYRLYDYDNEQNAAKFFCIEGNIEEKVFTRPKQIEVFLKSNS